MDTRRYNKLPNKRIKTMNGDDLHGLKGQDKSISKNSGSVKASTSFFQAELLFQTKEDDDWKVKKGRHHGKNRPQKQKQVNTDYEFERRQPRTPERDGTKRKGNAISIKGHANKKECSEQLLHSHSDKEDKTKRNDRQTESRSSDQSFSSTNKAINIRNDESKEEKNYQAGFTYTKLTQLSLKDSTDIIRTLANSRSGLDEFLKGVIKPDCMYLIIKILSKLTESDWEENKEHVLIKVSTPEFFKKIMVFVTCLATDEQSIRRRDEMEQFFGNLLTFFRAIMITLPTVAAEHLMGPLRTTRMAMAGVTEFQNVTLSTNLTDKMKELMLDYEERKKEKEQRDKIMKETKEFIHPKPLGSISNVPLFPRPEDIASAQGSIVPNKIKGPYQNVEQYLDIQFRLLREDFIAPIRRGINEYRIGQSDKKCDLRRKVSNLRIYQRVKFLKPKVIADKVGYDICFDPAKRLKVKWEYTKRFIFGSLLIFTTDNFHTFFLATVVKRDLAVVEKDRVVSVILCDTTELSQDILSNEFLMAESEVYFEPYYSVLKALQRFNSDTFPMKKYFVYVETKTAPPVYTRNGSDVYTVSTDDSGIPGRKTIKLFDFYSWPACDELGFDSSQLNAFKAALTNDLTIIQGPPGTGKTYLGLKIAATLLENSVICNFDRKTPILVICYTNHALDQFLEGILQKGLTNNVVRIGGRSKSDLLEPFNLKERRKSVVYYSASLEQTALLKDLKRKMSDIFENIKTLQDNLESLDRNTGILSLKTLNLVMSNTHKVFFRSNDDLLNWLLFGVNDKVTSQQNLISTSDKEVERNRNKNVTDEYGFDSSDFENFARLKEVLFDSIEFDESDDLQISNSKISIFYTCTIDEIQKKIEDCTNLYEKNLMESEGDRKAICQQMQEIEKVISDLNLILLHFQDKLKRTGIPTEDETNRLFAVQDVHTLNCNQRWTLYKSWIEFLKAGYWMMIGKLEENYRTGARRYEEVRQFDDLKIVQQADVVGITTTTAARLQAMLRELRPKIVIVEEAAEVLEAHIVASLSVYCQHLILIGDHKQLRPSPADYKLGKDYHLDISLFERLIDNGINYHTLTTQHRMRPEISRLLVPTIYPSLYDHPSTQTRQQISGMYNNVFFMTHHHFEEEVSDVMSKKNLFEARMVMLLARHLLLQGYRPDEITVLTTYSGQMYLLKDEQKRLDISRDLQVTVVDNFQGEENRIILLSLVRSNAENKIGFLKTENRVCVALSRARDGLYVFGNMDCLTAESVLWQKIKQSFIEQNGFGPALVLRCETHQNQLTRILTHDDFNAVLEGGCNQRCGETLPCGHKCKSMCHVSKNRHTLYRCSEPCSRFVCEEQHLCNKRCFELCNRCEIPMERILDCGHHIMLQCCVEYRNFQCKQLVTLKFPECKHEVQVQCHARDYKNCPEPCLFRLECGHACTRTCHITADPDHLEYTCPKPCARGPLNCTSDHKCPLACFEECQPCQTKVVKQLQCGHSVTTVCTDTALLCEATCTRTMSCGHQCKKLCFEECGDCSVKVEKVVALCGHKVKVACSTSPSKIHCKGQCSVILQCGHKCAKLCQSTCTSTDCEVLTKLSVALPCGHIGALMPCNIISSGSFDINKDKEQFLQYCNEPCLQTLKCGHLCSGTCGQCMQGRIHKVCDEDCNNTLICGHSCSVPCREICPPCEKRCQNHCVHTKCPKKCGEPCVPCQEPCDYRCVHTRCTKKCGDLCNKKPCTEPCYLKLPCKHDCVGFCGEPCPPCKLCNPEPYEEFFYTGEETEEDAKWILLNDCKHVVESRILEHWLQIDQEGSEIKLKSCPKCRPSEPNRYIVKTQRYMNQVKKTFKDIQAVKKKMYGEIKDIREKREKLLEEIHSIPPTEMTDDSTEKGKDQLKTLRKTLVSDLQYIKNNRRNEISIHKARLLNFMALIYLEIQRRLVCDWNKLLESCKEKALKHINFLVSVLNKRQAKISEEEIESFKLELQRLHRILDLFLLESNNNFVCMKSLSPDLQRKIGDLHERLKREVYSLGLFTEEKDENVRSIVKEMSKILNTVVTDEERRMIHRVMALEFHGGVRSTSRWYSCGGCGDVYCVADCGAINQIARCGNCKGTIGDVSRRQNTEMAKALQNI